MPTVLNPPATLEYNDDNHSYWYDGKRCSGISTLAKIPDDTFLVETYEKRMVAIGMTLEPNLVENLAINLENTKIINNICQEAKRIAKSHLSADRGSQMHRVLEYILLDQEDKFVTDQQRRDAVTLKRTLDKYHLVPHDNLVEQFVFYPEHKVAGRFDAILEKPDGTKITVDLKSGVNAVRYPRSTCVQLALYANAPHVSLDAPRQGNRAIIDIWREMPPDLDRSTAWVMLVEPDTDVGTLHPINIEHGWAGAQLALAIKAWRAALNYGNDITWPVTVEDFTGREVLTDFVNVCGETLDKQIAMATSIGKLRATWKAAAARELLTPSVQEALKKRAEELKDEHIPIV